MKSNPNARPCPVTIATPKKSFRASVAARLAAFAGAVLLACGVQPAKADVFFTEPFSTSASNWATNSVGSFAAWVSTGGPLGFGDGYITRTVGTSGSTVMFRGQDGFDSSSDGFVGNWLAAGITTFSIDIFQDSGAALDFSLRFASSANFPGAGTAFFSVPSGVWTGITIPIIDSMSVFQTYEGNDFNTIFSSIGNVQLSVSALPAAPYNLGIDNPTISVPEPATFALAGVGLALFGVMARRMKSNA